MEALILGALRRGAALNGLVRFGGERAIFSLTAPADVDFAGAGYPRCVFNWQAEAGAPRAGRLTIWIAALDESANAPMDMAARLREELDGMAFGGQVARVLRWQGTGAFDASAEERRAPRVVCAELTFNAYEFRRAADGPGSVASALEQAVGAALGEGFKLVYDAPSEGVKGGVPLYCVRLTALESGRHTAACRWLGFEAAVRLPGGEQGAAYAAYEALKSRDRLNGPMGCALIDSVRLRPEADGCAQEQIALRGRYNALRPAPPAQILNEVNISGAGYAFTIGESGAEQGKGGSTWQA